MDGVHGIEEIPHLVEKDLWLQISSGCLWTRSALWRRSGKTTGGARGEGDASPCLRQFLLGTREGRTHVATQQRPDVRAAISNSEVLLKWTRVTEDIHRIAVAIHLDAVKGSHYWIAVFYLDWIELWTAKLGTHKMELGDSVYAAERIIKKRIRNVSISSLATFT